MTNIQEPEPIQEPVISSDIESNNQELIGNTPMHVEIIEKPNDIYQEKVINEEPPKTKTGGRYY